MPKISDFKTLGEIKRFNRYVGTIVRLAKKANANLKLTKAEWAQLESSASSLSAISHNIPQDIH